MSRKLKVNQRQSHSFNKTLANANLIKNNSTSKMLFVWLAIKVHSIIVSSIYVLKSNIIVIDCDYAADDSEFKFKS